MTSQTISDSDILEGLGVKYLKWFGIWSVINHFRETGNKNAMIIVQFTITFILNLPYIVCQSIVYFIIDVDLQKATFVNVHFFPCLQMCMRHIVFWVRLENQCRIFNLIKKDFLTTIPEHKKHEVTEIYKKISRKTNIFCGTCIFANCTIISLWITMPSISVEYIEHHTGIMAAVSGGRQKILGGWYPLPMSKTPYYEIIYVYEALLVIWDSLMLAIYACVFYQPLMCLVAHYTVLGHHIATLKTDHLDKSTITDKRKSTDVYKELYDIIQDHKKLINYTKEVRMVYNPLVTMILAMGIFVQIFCVFQFLFGGSKDILYIIKFIEFMSYQGIEVSLFCFGSSALQEAVSWMYQQLDYTSKPTIYWPSSIHRTYSIIDKNITKCLSYLNARNPAIAFHDLSMSSNLQFSLYSSEWYKSDIKFRNTAQMIMVRERNGETLTAIRMYPVNVETMMGIFQFTYTVSAFMARMAE